MVSRIYAISDQFVDRFAALHPIAGTSMGVPGHEDRLTDYSPAAAEALNDLARSTLAELDRAPVESERDRVARDVMAEELRTSVEQFELKEHLRDLNVIASPFQSIRMCFDLMGRDTEEQWQNIARRLRRVPEALSSYRVALTAGQQAGLTASRRQAAACAAQAEVWAGLSEGVPPFFQSLLDDFDRRGLSEGGLRTDLEKGCEAAAAGYGEMRSFLQEEYLPRSTSKDAVGPDRYAIAARVFNGLDLDLEDTYRWGWDQVRWLEGEMEATAERIAPGQGLGAVEDLLENDPERAIEGVEEFRRWMQDLQDRTIADLDGRHFDIAGPVKRIEALIAPPGGALAMYYTGPSEDFSRPGRTWYPTGGKTRFPLWIEVSTAYHEGVPGHHFQIGTTKYLSGQLSRFQRLMAGTSGHIEGWALYAEWLMAELGYLENPDYYLGMLHAQVFRAARVVADIGMHLELAIPREAAFHPGETWTPDLGREFMDKYSPFAGDFVRSEIDRYLGWPGQAISYKVGERVWRAAREQANQRQGGGFDLKQWHTRALSLGPMGLAQLEREMSAPRPV